MITFKYIRLVASILIKNLYWSHNTGLIFLPTKEKEIKSEHIWFPKHNTKKQFKYHICKHLILYSGKILANQPTDVWVRIDIVA